MNNGASNINNNGSQCPAKFQFVSPAQPSKCKWVLGTKEQNPHNDVKKVKTKILPNILSQIGDTPLVKLNAIPKLHGVDAELLVKCEFLSPGGSVKDRIAMRMIEEAEQCGRIKPGWTLIEPTSGNTGIGLALAAAVKGYRCIIVMPQKMSNEKSSIIRALGAEVVRTPSSASYDGPNSNFVVAQKLQQQIPNSIILDQFRNAGNPLVHYYCTAEEIIDQCEGRIDAVVISAGTGGTITGIGRKIKEALPSCRVVAVDPMGSLLAPHKKESHYYEVEGIGYDFDPTVLDKTIVDEWVDTADKESFLMARELIAKEGLLVGGSSGSAVVAAIKVAKSLPAGSRIVTILPDGVRNYMTKFLDDKWMVERGFLSAAELKQVTHVEASPIMEQPWFWNILVSEIASAVGVVTVTEQTKCCQAIATMKATNYDQLPVIESGTSNKLLGMVTVSGLMAKIASGLVTVDSPVTSVIIKNFPKINKNETLGSLTSILKDAHYVVVIENKTSDGCDGERSFDTLSGILTHIDILNYLTVANSYEQ